MLPAGNRYRESGLQDRAGSTSSTSTPPASLGCTKLTRLPEVPRRGLRLLYDEPRRGTSGSRVNFVHPKDAGGVLVELVEPARS